MARLGITLVCAFGFALLLQSAVGFDAIAAAAVLAVVAVGWSVLLRNVGPRRRFAFSASHLPPTVGTIARLPVTTIRIGAALLRVAMLGGSPGKAIETAFLFGDDDDAVDRGRRAVAVTLGCLTPDAMIVDIDPHRSTARLHRLLAGQPAPDRTWLT